MPIGFVQTSLDSSSLERSFALAAEAGADGVECVLRRPEDVRALMTADGTRAVLDLKAARRLELPSAILRPIMEECSPFLHPDEARQLIRDAAPAARGVGAAVLLLPFLGKAAIETEAEFDRAVELLLDVAEDAEAADITLGVESNLNVNQQRHLMDHLAACPSVKLYYDAGNVLARKWDPATYLRDLGGQRICQVHLKDCRLGEEGTPPDYDVPLGSGNLDARAVAQALAAIGYAGWIILETPPTPDPLAAAKANLAFARALFA